MWARPCPRPHSGWTTADGRKSGRPVPNTQIHTAPGDQAATGRQRVHSNGRTTKERYRHRRPDNGDRSRLLAPRTTAAVDAVTALPRPRHPSRRRPGRRPWRGVVLPPRLIPPGEGLAVDVRDDGGQYPTPQFGAGIRPGLRSRGSRAVHRPGSPNCRPAGGLRPPTRPRRLRRHPGHRDQDQDGSCPPQAYEVDEFVLVGFAERGGRPDGEQTGDASARPRRTRRTRRGETPVASGSRSSTTTQRQSDRPPTTA
ncbi:hypothetical protein SALB_00050 [Streptomyces noursei]|uniref:Uncharacterized protein n=1 Tax=Streptomyces noursei TaxID=1971 RepID=A0A401QPP9_STRNR|nr:hypothetical protein SALB_00050 [Streptomyces noursei]